MEPTLPAVAFAVLIIAQLAAVIAVQIYSQADFFPPLDFAVPPPGSRAR
jgi:hypothetical protein